MTPVRAALVVGALILLLRSRAVAGSVGPSSGSTASSVSTLSFLGRDDLPRGVRNNNPGNLRISSNEWQGKIPVSENTDGAFEQFGFYVYGIRAMIKLIRDSYISRDGTNTIAAIINRYAPSSENNTAAYISQVSAATGINPNSTLDTGYNTIRGLVMAMARHENGIDAVNDTQFSIAWQLSQ